MLKKTRIILAIFLFGLFIAAAPAIVFYSLGYRLDLANKKITQTGGFYFKVAPKGAQVLLEGKPVKKTDFFFGATYIDNLLPKLYEVEIQKQGYHAWKKVLEVREKQVTDGKNIVLLPQDLRFETIAKNIQEFFPSPDQNKLVLRETGQEGWSLKLLELDRNIKSHLASEKQLGETSVAEFLDDFFEVPKQATSTIEQTKNDKEAEKLPEGIFSGDGKKLAYLEGSEVWVLFLKEELGQPSKKAQEKLLIGRFSEKIGEVFWLTNHYLIFNAGDKIKIAEIDDRDRINIVDLAEFKEPRIFWSSQNKKLYILSEGNLYLAEGLIP